jgi:hypothetical protein
MKTYARLVMVSLLLAAALTISGCGICHSWNGHGHDPNCSEHQH